MGDGTVPALEVKRISSRHRLSLSLSLTTPQGLSTPTYEARPRQMTDGRPGEKSTPASLRTAGTITSSCLSHQEVAAFTQVSSSVTI